MVFSPTEFEEWPSSDLYCAIYLLQWQCSCTFWSICITKQCLVSKALWFSSLEQLGQDSSWFLSSPGILDVSSSTPSKRQFRKTGNRQGVNDVHCKRFSTKIDNAAALQQVILHETWHVGEELQYWLRMNLKVLSNKLQLKSSPACVKYLSYFTNFLRKICLAAFLRWGLQ